MSSSDIPEDHVHLEASSQPSHRPDIVLPKYQYKPLNGECPEIRLIRFCTAVQTSTVLHIELYHASLDDKPNYAALSYTWGRPAESSPAEWDDPTCVRDILVNNQILQIRPNLVSALTTLRDSKVGGLTLWIDAICIDQSNIDERSAQVKQMHRIYRAAYGTIVWLGPSDDMTSMAFNKIRQVARSCINPANPSDLIYTVSDEFLDEYRNLVSKEIGDAQLRPSWDCVRALTTRCWWTRAWILQEVCLSAQTIVFCGPYSASWSVFKLSCLALMKYTATLPRLMKTDTTQTSRSWPILSDFIRAVARLEHSMSIFRHHLETGELLPLGAVLVMGRSRSATDPKDKVFAFLELVKDGHLFDVNYGQSVEEIFMNVAYYCIISTKTLSILSYCRFPPKLSTLPSWAPDWTEKVVQVRQPFAGFGTYPADNDQGLFMAGGRTDQSCVKMNVEKATLVVEGYFVDSIVFETLQRWDDDGSETSSHLHQRLSDFVLQHENPASQRDVNLLIAYTEIMSLRKWAEDHQAHPRTYKWIDTHGWQYDPDAGIEQFDAVPYQLTRETLPQACTRTLFADVISTDFGAAPMRLAKWKRSPEGKSIDLVRSLNFAARGRAFVVTESGFIALVPQEADVGDTLAIIKGNGLPILLRATEKGYVVIGASYVHGIMDGEMLDGIQQHGLFKQITLV